MRWTVRVGGDYRYTLQLEITFRRGAGAVRRLCANTSREQLMYRAKQDGPALLGLKHPWEH